MASSNPWINPFFPSFLLPFFLPFLPPLLLQFLDQSILSFFLSFFSTCIVAIPPWKSQRREAAPNPKTLTVLCCGKQCD
jgi:hypothetical protein